jgi:hypothetical protein
MPDVTLDLVLAEVREVGRALSSRMDGLESRMVAIETQLDNVTGGGKATLAFIGKQRALILQEQQQARATQRVTETLLTRLDVSIQGLTSEVRALREQQHSRPISGVTTRSG